MTPYRAAVIGVGKPPTPTSMEGFGIAYSHAGAYRALERVELVAAADISQDNLAAFAATFVVPATYNDYKEMLHHEKPDLVSICTWPRLHPEMVIEAAQAGVRGILCEKPMALSLGEADRMIQVCAEAGTRLSVCHQRRLKNPWTTARAWLDEGRIGSLIRMEGWIENWDLLSYGTHWLDNFFYFVHDQSARWVLAQIDATSRQRRYAHPIEDRSLTLVGFDGAVTGLLHLAPEAKGIGMRLIGSEGQIDILEGATSPQLISATGSVPLQDGGQRNGFEAAIVDLIGGIEGKAEPELRGSRARKVTESIMAAFASGIEQRMITLPFTESDFPLERLFEQGTGR